MQTNRNVLHNLKGLATSNLIEVTTRKNKFNEDMFLHYSG